MEKEKLTPQESIELIESMILRTKKRMGMNDGNIFLLWGYLTVAVSMAVWVLLVMTGHPAVNWLWFLIWIIGGVITPHMLKKKRIVVGVKSYSDVLCTGIWSVVGWCAIVCTFMALMFMLFGGKDCWSLLLVFALLIVGMAETFQGITLREKSLVFGGFVGIVVGLFTLCCVIGDVLLHVNWYMPLFIASFVCMMIIPGHILNHKASRQNERA